MFYFKDMNAAYVKKPLILSPTESLHSSTSYSEPSVKPQETPEVLTDNKYLPKLPKIKKNIIQ